MSAPENANGRPGDQAADAMTKTSFPAKSSAQLVGAEDEARRERRTLSRLLEWRKAIAAAEELTSTQKLVALVLSLRMNGAGSSCFPSQETIAADASLGLRAVRDALKVLDDRGLIRREGGRWRGDVTHYTACLPTERRHDVPPSPEERRQHVPPSELGKAAPDDEKGGTSFHERRHDVPTRTSEGRPEGDGLAAEGRSPAAEWHVVWAGTLDVYRTAASKAEARAIVEAESTTFMELEVREAPSNV